MVVEMPSGENITQALQKPRDGHSRICSPWWQSSRLSGGKEGPRERGGIGHRWHRLWFPW